jgi:hypothetical protein
MMPAQFNKDKASKNIASILEQLQTADPALLAEYRKVFKKEVSFFRRSWAAAWLLWAYEQGWRFEKSFRAGESEGRSGMKTALSEFPTNLFRKSDEGQRAPLLPEAESKRLFISIGRNRRVFPREILGLIGSKTSVPREDIGSIRILDNYSFVQVRDSAAEQIIEALNGVVFRGRTLTVNYAKLKKDAAETAAEETTDEDAAGDYSEQPDQGDNE